MTAHTTIGEGSASPKVTLSPTSRIPAKIASFDEEFVAVAKQDVRYDGQGPDFVLSFIIQMQEKIFVYKCEEVSMVCTWHLQ